MTRTLPLLLALVACKDDGDIDSGAPDTQVPAPECTGFSASPELWSTGALLVADYFTYSASGLNDYWSLFDLNGDGRDDLLITAHGNHDDAEQMGAHWYVRFSTGAGFGERVDWRLPFDHRELDGLYAPNYLEVVMDIDGDGLADLVLAQDPDTREVWGGEAAPHWKVYLGDGQTGFAEQAVDWGVPEGLSSPHEVHSNGRHTARDLDGDGQVELVVTLAPTGGNFGYAEGSPHWRVHARDGQGFSAGYSEWSLPPNPTGYDGAYTAWTDTAYTTNTTLDVTGDGLPDLVVPHSAQFPYGVFGDEGDWSWRVHVNTGAGFEVEPISWSVPDSLFTNPSDSAERVFPISTEWRTLQLDGRAPGLVVTRDPEADSPFVEDGQPIWAVFANTGVGFTDQHEAWTLPDEVFTTFWSSYGASDEGWFVNDLDADGCLDLVLTSGLDLGHPEPGDPDWSWRVYRGQ
ncbi:MAG: VCBS repeat-containing protein [Alphaproteobacteria bacterium]|nr:VCBS repeat-containing protein [Alphaproteobacteria bacterium]